MPFRPVGQQTGLMLHEIDAVVRALLTGALPDGVPVDFATPDATLAGQRSVNVFLRRVDENVLARAENWSERRDERGRLLGRQPPPRHYRVSYLLTAWDTRPEAEHALLGAALAALTRYAMVPVDLLMCSLAESGQPVTVDVGHPDLGPGTPPDWAALDIRPRAYLDVVVTFVVQPDLITELAAPASTLDLGLGAPPVAAPPRRPPGAWAGKRVRENVGGDA